MFGLDRETWRALWRETKNCGDQVEGCAVRNSYALRLDTFHDSRSLVCTRYWTLKKDRLSFAYSV